MCQFHVLTVSLDTQQVFDSHTLQLNSNTINMQEITSKECTLQKHSSHIWYINNYVIPSRGPSHTQPAPCSAPALAATLTSSLHDFDASGSVVHSGVRV